MHRAVAPDVLGPGLRAILWVQGCPQRCAGCIAPEGWSTKAGERTTAGAAAQWILSQPGIEGITLSGGEPMMQAAALAECIRLVRLERDLGVICFTGFVLPWRDKGLPGPRLRMTARRRELLSMIDLLIDGPYVAELHGDLLWRGSKNQRLLPLSPRYLDVLSHLTAQTDRSAGLAFTLDGEGRPQVIGVPARPGFRREMERLLARRGVLLGTGRHGPADSEVP